MALGKVIFSREDIDRRTAELACEINAFIPAGKIHVIITLKGALYFGVDLIRALGRQVTIGFITASSYGDGTESSGEVLLKAKDTGEITARRVLIVEDIIDTGRTLEFVVNTIRSRKPASVHTVAFIDKPSRREVAIDADFVGFPVEDVFLVGYGLDYAEAYRELPCIRSFEP
ncbi:MAG: hypoxanthine phosphoribosyltransferase [Nitrospinota bacterium]|jgi:hypoxanthine phosphoribosyltransferase|nr:hypoxanthine phosphoribosyltransferase [Nitrospinota bacterium]